MEMAMLKVIDQYSVQCSVQYSVFSVQCSVFSVQYSVFSVQYSVVSDQFGWWYFFFKNKYINERADNSLILIKLTGNIPKGESLYRNILL